MGILPLAPNQPSLRAAQLAEPLRTVCDLAYRGGGTFPLCKGPNGRPSRHGIDVCSFERSVEPDCGLMRVLPASLERSQPGLRAAEFTRRPIARLLQLDPTLEPRDEATHNIHLRITSVAPIPPSIPATSASRITLVCIHCARSACRFSLST